MLLDDSLVELIRQHVQDRIGIHEQIDDEQVRRWIEDAVFAHAEQHHLRLNEKRDLIERVFAAMRGYDVLQPLLDDERITEVMVNRYDEIFIERDGRLMKTDVKFRRPEDLEDVIQLIASQVNRVVNTSSPIVDARLKDGSRVNIVLPPVSLNGPTLTIRKFPAKSPDLAELTRRGMLSEQASDVLAKLVAAGYNVFISGGTGTGKTTLLNALSGCIPRHERVITIEDSAELKLLHLTNLVRLETRNANMEGKGEITIRHLIRTALRMRPDRIIVGEIRGGEAIDMLQAMNTGHDGSISTGHANSAADMLSRLETMVLSDAQLPIPVIRKQIGAAIDILIHIERLRDHSRRVTEICEVCGVEDGEILLNPLFTFQEYGEREDGRVEGSLVYTGRKLVRNAKWLKAGGRGETLFEKVSS
jgi:pilus assembly protein CpaF